jgi:hypothetical protein
VVPFGPVEDVAADAGEGVDEEDRIAHLGPVRLRESDRISLVSE